MLSMEWKEDNFYLRDFEVLATVPVVQSAQPGCGGGEEAGSHGVASPAVQVAAPIPHFPQILDLPMLRVAAISLKGCFKNMQNRFSLFPFSIVFGIGVSKNKITTTPGLHL